MLIVSSQAAMDGDRVRRKVTKRRIVMRTTRPIFVLSLLAVLAAAYISAPQVASGQDIQSLAGRWTGYVSPTRGSNIPLVVDVKPDGSYTSTWGSKEGRGILKMEGGKLVGEGQLAIGTGQVAQGTGKTELSLTTQGKTQIISGLGRDQDGPYNIHLTRTMAAAAPAAAAVGDEDLLKLQNDDNVWVIPGKNYSSTRYSTLSQINASNVAKLRQVWSFSTGALRGHEGQPLVIHNTMYVHSAYPNHVFALDLTKEGAPMKWRYTPN